MQKSGEFLDCASLRPGSFIEVETKNRHYQIESWEATQSASPVTRNIVRVLWTRDSKAH
jgi:hypothetical protein